MNLASRCFNRLIEFIKEERLLESGDKVLLACSGGADSSAMLYLFSKIRHTLNLSLLAVHVNHQLRGIASEKDEQTVREQCLKLNVPLIVRKINISDGADLESRARDLRFAEFAQVLRNYRFNKVLLAHHKSDQAETMLMNLFRGAGLSGLSGIKPLSGNNVHPMLCFSSFELRELLTEVEIVWAEDESNQDNKYTRNRLRNELIPHLEQNYNPELKEKLSETAMILNHADMYIKNKALQRLKRAILDSSPQKMILSIPDILASPKIEQYYLLRGAWSIQSGSESDFMSAHFADLLSLMLSDGSKHINLPKGIVAVKQYQELILGSKDEVIKHASFEELQIDIDRSRAVHMDYRFTFKYLKVLPNDAKLRDETRVIIDADRINIPFVIRSRKEGDRFMPSGMTNLKKLKDFFIDEKVPKYDRDSIPVFDDGEKLFWIAGCRMDERVRFSDSTTRYLQITAEPLTVKPKRAANRKKSTRGYDEFYEL